MIVECLLNDVSLNSYKKFVLLSHYNHIHTYTLTPAAVVSGNVVLSVSRRGQLGDVEVTWTAASVPGSQFSIGTTTPATDSFTLTPSSTAARFSLTASPIQPHGTPEAFAIQLSTTSLTQQFAAGIDPSASLAIIEEWGVVQLGGRTFTGLEGENVRKPFSLLSFST